MGSPDVAGLIDEVRDWIDQDPDPAARAELVLVCGGLGPTADDLTALWGTDRRRVSWPITMRIGRL